MTTVEIIKKNRQETSLQVLYMVFTITKNAKLIAQMPTIDSNGASSLMITKIQDTVYLKEISVPVGYLIDTKAYGIKLLLGKIVTRKVTDERVRGTLHLIKKDKETGEVIQGDVIFEGAVYGLFIREDIVHPDGKTGVLYKAGIQIITLIVDTKGNASEEELYLGKYYVKELSPPVGYLADEKEHDIDVNYKADKVKTVERSKWRIIARWMRIFYLVPDFPYTL